jgi:hypothetical protein
MNPKGQKQHPSAGTDQSAGHGHDRREPLDAASQQPKGTPTRRNPSDPDTNDQEERSDLADIGEADEQEGVVEGTKEGSAQQDPPATLPQDRHHERRHNL